MADQIYMKTNCHFLQKLTISISAFQLFFQFNSIQLNLLCQTNLQNQ